MVLKTLTTVDELINSVTSDDVEWEQIGRDFFAQDFDPAQAAAFFSYLLDQELFEQICIVMQCSFINKKSVSTEYFTDKKLNSLESTYFDNFIKIAQKGNITLRELMPFFVESFSAPKTSRLGKWNSSIANYIKNEAKKDFDGVLEILTMCDPKYTAYEPLVEADRDATMDTLINRLLFEKHINKTAIRKFLVKHKVEITENLDIYQSSDIKVREAIVRLLLLFKHDNSASKFLDSISQTEKAVSVLKLINKQLLPSQDNDEVVAAVRSGKTGGKSGKTGGKSGTTKVKTGGKSVTRVKTGDKEKAKKSHDPLEEFYEYMVLGQEWTVLEFEREILNDPLKSIIASTLFFSVFGGSVLTDIVVVEQGKICNLDNQPITISMDKTIKVLHPAEIPTKYEYIRRLNIQQGIDQLRRKVFIPSDSEKSTGISLRLKGTVAHAKDIRKNMRLYDFKALNKSPDGLSGGAGVRLGDYICTISFSPIDLDNPLDATVKFGDIRFYRFADLINIGGKLYTENVPLCPIYGMASRVFSELMYSVYNLAGCI